MPGHRKESGFTLIELLIALAVAAILAAIAIPAYTSYVRRAQRVDATAALLRIQNAQEKYYLGEHTYTDQLSELKISGTEHGYYTLALADATEAELRKGFTATATATGPQADDEACRTFTINATGVKGAKDASGNDNAAECWR